MLFTRREMLRVTTRGLAALGVAPGIALAQRQDHDFRFIVVNDLHYRDARCDDWLEGVVRGMRSHRADFCVLNGDLVENGQGAQFAAVRRIFRELAIPIFVTIGNHDHREDDDRSAFEQAFPNSLNYHFAHKGCQFVAVDSTQGDEVFYTKIAQSTLDWLDENLPQLDKNKPTVLLTHFPLGSGVWCRPRNAPQVLTRFHDYNLRAVFNGHWHGFTHREFEDAQVVTNRCCSWWRANNDGTPEKGYFLCDVRGGEIERTFYEVKATPQSGRIAA
ncbi:MAG: hypothetical protein QOD99_1886 [Chthoniobacter sp.]|jgi:hypothetical protein|nr:hypothetical protein [Chthoniobacter sp.]